MWYSLQSKNCDYIDPHLSPEFDVWLSLLKPCIWYLNLQCGKCRVELSSEAGKREVLDHAVMRNGTDLSCFSFSDYPQPPYPFNSKTNSIKGLTAGRQQMRFKLHLTVGPWRRKVGPGVEGKANTVLKMLRVDALGATLAKEHLPAPQAGPWRDAVQITIYIIDHFGLIIVRVMSCEQQLKARDFEKNHFPW